MGMSKQKTGVTGSEVSPVLYQLDEVPKPHSAFEAYGVKFSPNQGLCFIKAIGKDIKTNGHGFAIKSAFNGLREKLDTAYGKSDLTDLLVRGSICDEPEDWMMGLKIG